VWPNLPCAGQNHAIGASLANLVIADDVPVVVLLKVDLGCQITRILFPPEKGGSAWIGIDALPVMAY